MKFCCQAITLSLALLYDANGFHNPLPVTEIRTITPPSSLATSQVSPLFASRFSRENETSNSKQPSTLRRVWNRLDTVESAGLQDVKVAGIFDKIKKIHGPKTYLALSLLAGARWTWLFRSPYYLLAVAFCVKWYRARYVFKIPVWDRQPNWNNIVTSKEQEKDLKAFTCKTCGSTLFIAKTREFFFEGDTGIGGLGCFSCGAKGKDNFVQDRDRILEDVGDMDDYFEYERPLDFVSRAERRKLMKETGGDENKANEILMARAAAQMETEAAPSSEQAVNGGIKPTAAEEVVDADVEDKEANGEDKETEEEDAPAPGEDAETRTKASSSSPLKEESSKQLEPEQPKPKKAEPKNQVKAKIAPPASYDDLDVLNMDAL